MWRSGHFYFLGSAAISEASFISLDSLGRIYYFMDVVIFQDGYCDLTWPNKSPEPTAVGACRSAVAVHAEVRRWLSFFR